jgi:hypothetical protein
MAGKELGYFDAIPDVPVIRLSRLLAIQEVGGAETVEQGSRGG